MNLLLEPPYETVVGTTIRVPEADAYVPLHVIEKLPRLSGKGSIRAETEENMLRTIFLFFWLWL